MKKFMFLIPVAALAMTACTNETNEFVGSDQAREISFALILGLLPLLTGKPSPQITISSSLLLQLMLMVTISIRLSMLVKENLEIHGLVKMPLTSSIGHSLLKH